MAVQIVTSSVENTASSQLIEGIENVYFKIEVVNDDDESLGTLYDENIGKTFDSQYLAPIIKQTNVKIRYTIECDSQEVLVNLIDTQVCVSFNYEKGYAITYDANGAD